MQWQDLSKISRNILTRCWELHSDQPTYYKVKFGQILNEETVEIKNYEEILVFQKYNPYFNVKLLEDGIYVEGRCRYGDWNVGKKGLNIILCDTFIPFEQRAAIAADFKFVYIDKNLDGYSFEEMKHQLANQEGVYVTSDERVLLFASKLINIDNIYLHQAGETKPIRLCTRRLLRIGHNIMKLYLSGEFK